MLMIALIISFIIDVAHTAVFKNIVVPTRGFDILLMDYLPPPVLPHHLQFPLPPPLPPDSDYDNAATSTD